MKMKTKTYRFWYYKRTSQDQRTNDYGVVEKTWHMASDIDLTLYAKYEATRIGAYRYEEVMNHEES